MKNWKLLTYSLGAFALYIIFKYAALYGNIRNIIESKSYEHPRIVGIYVLAEIFGWFLLLFGTMGLGMFFYHLLKPKKED